MLIRVANFKGAKYGKDVVEESAIKAKEAAHAIARAAM